MGRGVRASGCDDCVLFYLLGFFVCVLGDGENLISVSYDLFGGLQSAICGGGGGLLCYRSMSEKTV